MGAAERIGRTVIRLFSRLINISLIFLLLLLLAYGGYAIWDSNTIVESALSVNYEKYKPAAYGGPTFEELQAINPDVCSWITIYGTTIDYPVTHTDNNSTYISTDVTGTYSLTGSLFIDYQNKNDFSDFNTIIYGHNMTPKVMFGDIKTFLNKDFFDSREYGDLYYNGRHYGIDIFALITTDAYNPDIYSPAVTGDKEKEEYINNIYSLSVFNRDIGVTKDDHIVLLSTCSNTGTNERHLLAGRITDELYQNEYKVTETPEDKTVFGVDTQKAVDFFHALPLWLWITIGVSLILLISVIIYRGIKKRQRKKNLHE